MGWSFFRSIEGEKVSLMWKFLIIYDICKNKA